MRDFDSAPPHQRLAHPTTHVKPNIRSAFIVGIADGRAAGPIPEVLLEDCSTFER